MSIKAHFAVYIGLILLLLGTVFSHSFELGHWNVVLNMSIAAAKALLIVFFFMHLLREGNTVRIFSLIGIAWLSIMFSLTLADYLQRDKPAEFYPLPPASSASVTPQLR